LVVAKIVGVVIISYLSPLDTIAPLHHCSEMNRLTITLPDDLYAMARAHAVANRKSISKAIGDLLRRGRESDPPLGTPRSRDPNSQCHPLTGFPLIDLEEGATMEDIRRSLEDEDARDLEVVGSVLDEMERGRAR